MTPRKYALELTFPCSLCSAPLRPEEFADHERACGAILAGNLLKIPPIPKDPA